MLRVQVLETSHGMPSVDPLSSLILYNIELHKLRKVSIRRCKYYISASQPKLILTDSKVVDHPALIRQKVESITENKIDKKYEDNPVVISKIRAYKALCSRFLESAALLNAWAVESNAKATVKLYTKDILFPFKIFFVRSLRKRIQAELEDLCGEEEVSMVMQKVYAEAKSCLYDISILIGKKEFIFGQSPTTLDIYLCSYLAPALLIKYPDTQLKNIIQEAGLRNLTQYVNNFVYKFGVPQADCNNSTAIEETDKAPTYSIFLAGFVAMSVMIGYGLLQGIIKAPN